jgi:hypothetical protein
MEGRSDPSNWTGRKTSFNIIDHGAVQVNFKGKNLHACFSSGKKHLTLKCKFYYAAEYPGSWAPAVLDVWLHCQHPINSHFSLRYLST